MTCSKTDLTLFHSGKEKKIALAYDLVKAQVRDVTLLRGGLKQKKKCCTCDFENVLLHIILVLNLLNIFLHVFLPLIAHSDSLHWSQHEPGPILWPSHCDMELGEPLGMCSLLSLNTEYVSCDTIQRWRGDTLLLLCVVARIFSVL